MPPTTATMAAAKRVAGANAIPIAPLKAFMAVVTTMTVFSTLKAAMAAPIPIANDM